MHFEFVCMIVDVRRILVVIDQPSKSVTTATPFVIYNFYNELLLLNH